MFTASFRPHQKGQYLIISLDHFLPSPILLDPPFSIRRTTAAWCNNRNKPPTYVILKILANDAAGKGENVPVHVMKACRGMEVQLHRFNLGTRWR